MKKFIVLLVIVSLMLAMVIGCGQQEAEETDVPVEVKQAEQMDSTRLDSAAVDSMVPDTTEVPADSM